jgi:hypothetical protein
VVEAVFGHSLAVLIGLTGVIAGFAAVMTGDAVASGWKPAWLAAAYAALLAFAERFLAFALFGAPLAQPLPTALVSVWLVALALAAHRSKRAHMMVSQYPWLYEQAGPFGWRERGPS